MQMGCLKMYGIGSGVLLPCPKPPFQQPTCELSGFAGLCEHRGESKPFKFQIGLCGREN